MTPEEAKRKLSEFADETVPGVFHCRTWGQNIGDQHVDAIEVLAAHLGKARLCMHPSADDVEQQMLVAISRSFDDAIHYHPWKQETVILVRGSADHCTYDDRGNILRTVSLARGGLTYVNTEPGVSHHVVVSSRVLVFWELAKGPFSPGSTVRVTPLGG